MAGWEWSNSGEKKYVVKEVYAKLHWQLPVPSKVKGLVWKMVFNRIQTVENLKKRNIVADGVNLNCVFCDATMETTNHLMFECNFSYYIWLNCYQWLSELRTLPNNCKCHF
ncbi:hypothetical protein GmHk_03G006518 [Glycine max]|nr:hypothetical protein GmHk_03G006518 [Glycine max]